MSASFPTIDGFVIRNKIGDGGFAKVYRAVNYAKNVIVACKVVPITQKTWTPAFQKELYKEIKVHSQLKHQNILEFMASETFEDNDDTRSKGIVPAVYMLLEIASGGDLFDKIVPDIGVPENVAHLFFRELIAGVEFIHSKGVCHRDLKPENAMLSINGVLKVSDFGLCAVYKHKGMERLLSERCGSMPYVAPELNSPKPYQAEPIDIWGCGVILFTLLVGNTPWDEPSAASPEYVAYVQRKIFDTAPWDRLRGPVLEFLLKILNPDPASRIKIPEMAQEPWFSQPNPLLSADDGIRAAALAAAYQQHGLTTPLDPPEADPGLIMGDEMDVDGDTRMMTMTNASQFTQQLMLFSQTQSGQRYTPELTRFYTGNGLFPQQFLELAVSYLQAKGWKCRQPEYIYRESSQDDTIQLSQNMAGQLRQVRMKIGGFDDRKQKVVGFFGVEPFRNGSFVVMTKEEGDPLHWKRLWRELISAPSISPYVLRKGS